MGLFSKDFCVICEGKGGVHQSCSHCGKEAWSGKSIGPKIVTATSSLKNGRPPYFDQIFEDEPVYCEVYWVLDTDTGSIDDIEVLEQEWEGLPEDEEYWEEGLLFKTEESAQSFLDQAKERDCFFQFPRDGENFYFGRDVSTRSPLAKQWKGNAYHHGLFESLNCYKTYAAAEKHKTYPEPS